ncbi:hypothetical protein O9H85_31600 [Paenibacillus filicis]|uniref:Spore coat protein n=1 Tax=Paenibacillus gyeongsangnamensis TaxID=3388067 RepID=A0ABT4QJF2_9BACL|nr:hypothetical protein [Paenibacillus filicis]MCZ8516831.1 hypothetical protein [Paenibacillus filicis]
MAYNLFVYEFPGQYPYQFPYQYPGQFPMITYPTTPGFFPGYTGQGGYAPMGGSYSGQIFVPLSGRSSSN